MNEAANDSARISGQDRKIPPALGTNQIAGFGGFRPLASLEKYIYNLGKYVALFRRGWNKAPTGACIFLKIIGLGASPQWRSGYGCRL